jgi:outer membrane immunogenic protein
MIRSALLAAVSAVVLGSVAMAADLPSTKGPPVYAPPPPPVFSWTGVYIGGQMGYEWGNDFTQERFTATGVPDGFFQSFSNDGVVGGGHIGYNYQISQFVFGVEGDVNGSGVRGGYTLANGNGTNSRSDIQASIRGRIGFAFDRVLIYATGGGAYADFEHTYFTPAVGESFHNGRVGWTVGGGIEYAIDNNWSVRAEYRYSDFGSFTNASTVAFPGFSYTHHPRENLAQIGFSYKFDMAPPPAPPLVTKY